MTKHIYHLSKDRKSDIKREREMSFQKLKVEIDEDKLRKEHHTFLIFHILNKEKQVI